MGKTTNTFERLQFWLLQNLTLVKIYAASRESNIELLILVSDFMVNSMLQNTQWVFLLNAWNVLSRIHRRKKEKKDRSCTWYVGTITATSVKLLDIAHESYGFSTDLIETIN